MSDTGGGRRWPGWLEVALPGLAAHRTGRLGAGLGAIALTASALLVLVLARDRVAATFGSRAIEDWVALGTLVAMLVAGWGAGLRARRPVDAPGGTPSTAPSGVAWREFRRNRLASIGAVIMVAVYLVALLTPYLAPYDPSLVPADVAANRYLAPSLAHPMGTDGQARDVLSRVLYGARISLSIGFVAVGIAVTLGTAVGAVAGFFGGAIDAIVMRVVDMVISFPRLVLLITVIALFERSSIFLVIAVLGLTLWPSTARIVRGEVLSLREREFVQAARALGLGDARIISRHIVPNVLAPVIVAATLGIGNTILLEAGLSFLGFGVAPPTPSWGNMVADGRGHLVRAWWVSTFPGLAIVLTVVAFNLIGDALRDALDPRLRVST